MKIYPFKFPVMLIVASLFFLTTGCVALKKNHTLKDVVAIPTEEQATLVKIDIPYETIPVIAQGRYLLVAIDTTQSQHSLLDQIIDISIPVLTRKKPTTVADAMQYALLNSGYELCELPSIELLHRFRLPLAHRHLGPISLKDALNVLAGGAWQLEVDQLQRKVCFINSTELNLTEDIR